MCTGNWWLSQEDTLCSDTTLHTLQGMTLAQECGSGSLGGPHFAFVNLIMEMQISPTDKLGSDGPSFSCLI